MLKIIIYDDETCRIQSLTDILSRRLVIPYTAVVCQTKEELYTYIKDHKEPINVLIMDIELGEMKEIVAVMKQYFMDVKVIFIIGYWKDYVEKLFLWIKPFGILGKPVDEDVFITLLMQAYKLQAIEQNKTLPIQFKHNISNIPIDTIRYIESDKRRVYIYTESGIECCYRSLDELESRLPDYFLRCHKSFLVNMKKIERFNNSEIILYTGEKIRVSRNKNIEAMDKYRAFLQDVWV